MKATIDYLWETGRKIITFDDSDFERPSTFKDLAKCENVIVGEKVDEDRRCKSRYVYVDDCIYIVTPAKVNHPSGCGVMYILEVN